MGGVESGTLVDQQFSTLANQRNFLANMEQVNPSKAYNVVDKLQSKAGSVSRFVLVTKGKKGTVSSWQTKHLFVCTWVIESIPFDQYKFIKHKYQGFDFISINLDACAFNYMTYFMDLSMFFLSKDEFLQRIVDLCNDSDPLIANYIRSPYDQPVIEKPLYATATPSMYYVMDKSMQSDTLSRDLQNEDINLNSSAMDQESDSSSSRLLPHPYIPELEDLQFSETDTSFISPIPEYSDSTRDFTINSSSASSVAPIVSESGIESDVSGAFVNGSHYKHHDTTSRTRDTKTNSKSSRNTKSRASHTSQLSEDSGTMEGTISGSESGSSARRRRAKARELAEQQATESQRNTRQGRGTNESDILDFSDGPARNRSRRNDDENDSIVLDEPSTDSLNSTSSRSSRASSHSSQRSRGGSQVSNGSKRRPAVLVPRDQVPDELIISTSESSRSSRRRNPPQQRRAQPELNDVADEALDISQSSRSSGQKRRQKYMGGTNDQVPMSSDNGLADQPTRSSVSSKDFSQQSRSSNVSSRSGDTRSVPGAGDFQSKPTGLLQSGSTNVRSNEFRNYLGTGTSTASGHRNIHNQPEGPSTSTSNQDSTRTDSRMRTRTSDFSTDKFKPFSQGNNQSNKESFSESSSASGSSRGSRSRGSNRFQSKPQSPADDDSISFGD